MNIPRIAAPTSAALFAAALPSSASTSLVGQFLSDFTVTTLNDYTTSQSETNGRAFVGGTLNATSAAPIVTDLPAGGTDLPIGVFANQINVSTSNVQINQGGLATNSTVDASKFTFNNNSGNGAGLLQGAAGGARIDSFLAGPKYNTTLGDFGNLLQAGSVSLGNLATANTVFTPSSNNPTLAVTGGGVAVFNLTNADLAPGQNANPNLQLLNGAMPDSIIINVSGTTYSSQFNLNGLFNQLAEIIIWNFPDADAVDFGQREVRGSVLAPNATFTADQTLGSVIAYNINQGGGETRPPYFTGQLPELTVMPEVSAVLPLAGLFLTGAFVRRRKPALKEKLTKS